MTTLPDPRRYRTRGAPERLLELTRASLATGDPIARSVHNDSLIAEVRARFAANEDAAVTAALESATSAAEFACLDQRAREAAETPLSTGEIGARLFSLPLAIVAGGRSGAQLASALPDIDAVSALLAEHEALGDVQRFSLGNALCGVERLETLSPGELARAHSDARGDALARLASHFEPDPIVLSHADESVHLRFLVGAAWVSSEARRWIGAGAQFENSVGYSVRGSVGNAVGKWATPLTHLLARQLAQAEVTVLPLARPPLPLALAASAGRAAQLELSFQLFAGGALRRARASIGEPTVMVAAHRSDDALRPMHGEVRITLSSVFDQAMCDAFAWPIGPGDDLVAITASITGLLAECRVEGVVLVPEVQPDRHPVHTHERLLLTVANIAPAGAAAVDPDGARRQH